MGNREGAEQKPAAGAASACHPQAHGLKSVHTELVRVGYVNGAHGLRGALRMHLDNPDSDILHHVQRLTLAHGTSNNHYEVVGAQRAGRGNVKVTLEGINTIEAAAALRGAILMVAATDLPATVSGEFYYFQAVGCEVVTTAGVSVGIIEEVFSNGANDVLVVRDRLAERLVPVIEDVVKETDWIARRVTIEAIPGLLD